MLHNSKKRCIFDLSNKGAEQLGKHCEKIMTTSATAITAKSFIVKIYGFEKGTVNAASAQSAMIKASFIWANGNTAGISVIEVKN